jgi:hypothetical protein
MQYFQFSCLKIKLRGKYVTLLKMNYRLQHEQIHVRSQWDVKITRISHHHPPINIISLQSRDGKGRYLVFDLNCYDIPACTDCFNCRYHLNVTGRFDISAIYVLTPRFWLYTSRTGGLGVITSRQFVSTYNSTQHAGCVTRVREDEKLAMCLAV